MESAIKIARRKFELSMKSAMPCKVQNLGTGKPVANTYAKFANQSMHAFVEAHESTRKRLEGILHKDHEHHIAGKGFNSSSHHALVHKFESYAQEMKIPDANAVAVDKEWEKVETLPAWQMTKVRSKREVIQEAQKEGRTDNFATLMDVYHRTLGV